MKTPDEIKNGLECCHINDEDFRECEECPYAVNGFNTPKCDVEMAEDAIAYIQQLEAERDAAIHDMHEAQGIVCLICKNHYQPDPAVKKYGCKEFGEHYPEEGSLACGMFEWRGVQKEE